MYSCRWRIWIVLGVYGVLTAIVTQPTLAHLGTHIPGSEGDALNHLWTFQWVKSALLSGQSPFYTGQLYHPHGVSLLFHNIAWLHIAAWLPLQVFIGAASAYSLIFIANFTVNAFAFYLFAREESGSEMASFVGGLVCGFWPYTLSHHNHPNLILIGWIPLTMLYLRRTIKGDGKRDVVWTAVFLALIGLTRWQLLVMSILPIGSYLIYQLCQQRLTRPILARLALSGFMAMILLSPLAAPVLSAQLSRDNPDDLFVEETSSQTDLLAYFVPNRYHPLWGQAAFQLYDNFGVNKVYTPFIGYTVLLLIVVAAVTRWRKVWFWLLLTGLTILLALGPSLRFNGNFYGPLPYLWLQDFFLVKIIRHSDRLNVLLAVSIGMCVVWGITAVSRHRLPWLASLFIITEALMAYPQYPLDIPAWYQQIAQTTDHYAFLDIPMGSRSFDKEYMLYQLTHGKPLVGGHVSRLPREALAFINSVPLLQAAQADNESPEALVNVSHQMKLLAQAGVRYLVLHKKFLSQEQTLAWQAWLIRRPLFEDDALVVYETAAYSQQPAITQPIITNEQGVVWGVVQTAVSPATVTQAGNIDIQIGWGSHQPPQSNDELCFQLQGGGEIVPLAPCVPLAPQWPPTQWGSNEWVYTSHHYNLSPYLAGDDYQVILQVGEEATAVAGTFSLETQPRQFTPPRPQTTTRFIWPEALNLAGYDLNVEANTFTITLYWQARQRMEVSYKFFLHVLNSESGIVTAQEDAVPQNWTYPTNWWEADEFVADTVTVTVPAGTYDLLLGWYEPETGERLPVQTADGIFYPGQFVPLTTVSLPGS
jgi:hypothetical protein